MVARDLHQLLLETGAEADGGRVSWFLRGAQASPLNWWPGGLRLVAKVGPPGGYP